MNARQVKKMSAVFTSKKVGALLGTLLGDPLFAHRGAYVGERQAYSLRRHTGLTIISHLPSYMEEDPRPKFWAVRPKVAKRAIRRAEKMAARGVV